MIFINSNITSLQFFYVVFGVSLVMSLIYHFLPEKKALKFLKVYHIYQYSYKTSHAEKYDFSKTLRNYKIFAVTLLIYSVFTIILTYIFGSTISDVGFWIFLLIVLLKSKSLDPVKDEDGI